MMGQDKQLLTWPLVQQLYTRAPNTVEPPKGAPLYDSRLVNAYAEMIPGTKGDYWIFKRPGVGPVSWSPASNGVPSGVYTYTLPNENGISITLFVTNGNLYVSNSIGGGFTQVLGFSITPGVPCFFETINSNPVTIVILSADPYGNLNQGGVYTPSTGLYAAITDSTFATISRVPGLAFLDDWFFVMDNKGTIWNTQNQSSVLVWSALNTIPASNYGDVGVFLARQLNYVIAMKQWTTQVFYDAGAQVSGQGTPLGPVPDSIIPYGCAHPYSVQKIDETLIWISSNQELTFQVIVLDALTPTIVSSPSVERILKNAQIITATKTFPFSGYSVGLFSFSFKIPGHRFYGITIPLSNITLVFDLDQKLWYIWTDANGNYWPYGFFGYTAPNYTAGTPGVHICQNLVTGGVYPLNDMYTYPTDNGVIFPVDIYTPSTSFGTLRTKQLNMMYFDTDVTKGSKMLARHSDNDYNSWTNFREVRLDFSRPQLDDEGSFDMRAYHFRHALACPFRLRSSGLDMDIGIL